MKLLQRICNHIKMHGLSGTASAAVHKLCQRILRTHDRAVRRREQDAAMLRDQRAHQPDAGLISVVVPVYNTDPDMLRALIASLQRQTYANWEAILYDGASTRSETAEALNAVSDPRIRVIRGERNEGISGNTNDAIALSRGEYVAFCDHDDLLAPDALWHTAKAIADEHPDMLYTDEDRVSSDGRCYSDPHRKPDFSHAALCEGNYICHMMTVRREVLDALGGLRPDFDGSQDHDLALRISEVTERICHIPLVLYHWRRVRTSVSSQQLDKCIEASKRAVREHLAKMEKQKNTP